MICFRVTLFPDPLRPSRQNALERGISNVTSSSTRWSPNAFVTRSKRIAISDITRSPGR